VVDKRLGGRFLDVDTNGDNPEFVRFVDDEVDQPLECRLLL
jgi:hypothetical protein